MKHGAKFKEKVVKYSEKHSVKDAASKFEVSIASVTNWRRDFSKAKAYESKEEPLSSTKVHESSILDMLIVHQAELLRNLKQLKKSSR